MEAVLAVLVTGLGVLLLGQYLVSPAWCRGMNRQLALVFGVAALACSGCFALLALERLGVSTWAAVQLFGALLGVVAGIVGVRVALRLPREVSEHRGTGSPGLGRGFAAGILILLGDVLIVWGVLGVERHVRWLPIVVGLGLWFVAWAVAVSRTRVLFRRAPLGR